ncbi:MAG: SprB repeat-containing protein [Lewinellaceae bacterium]|nr:SprB repeat-containing protein [Lewinellaceae bacterium]
MNNTGGPALSTTTTPVNCFGGSNGAIDLTVTSGTAPYTYIWSNGFTAQDPSGLTAGTYTVTVTDANSCTATASATVAQPTDIILTKVVTDANCYGSADGSINLSVSGGTPGYTYLWSNGFAGQDPNGLVAGTYTVTVTDSHGCTKTTSATVGQPTDIVLTKVVTNANCYGSADGSINLSVSGGTPAYTYLWSNGFTGQDPSGLVAGTYTVTVTDSHGCTKMTSATVGQPTNIVLTSTTVNSTCGNANGSINLMVSGGSPNYTFNWSNGFMGEDPTGLLAGTYTVTVTDSHGCTKTTSATVNNTGGPALSTTTTPVNCFGGSNGAIDLTVTSGTAPYTYNWSNGFAAQDPSGLIAGTYTVTVTDANSCTATASATVAQPSDIVLTKTVTDANCFGSANGSIDLTVTGGSPAYAYAWSNGFTGQDPIGLAAGTYTVTVTDSPRMYENNHSDC